MHDTYNISIAIAYPHRLLDPEILGVAALPLAGLLTAGCVDVSAPCEAAAGASKVLLHGPAATLHAELRLEDLGPVAVQHLARTASAPVPAPVAMAAADNAAPTTFPVVAVAIAASPAVPPMHDSTAAAAGWQGTVGADMAAANGSGSTSEASTSSKRGSDGSGSDAESALSQCSAGSRLVGQLWDAANTDQQAAALEATSSSCPVPGGPDTLQFDGGGIPAIDSASEPKQQCHAVQPPNKHTPADTSQHQQRQQAAVLPVQKPAAALPQAACHLCEARLRRHGSRKQEAGRRKQARAAAARRAEFMAAWRLAVWRSEQEKRFTARLEVRKRQASATQVQWGH